MKPARICDECHGELPGDAPEGLCPQCLLKFAGAELGIPVRIQEEQSRNRGFASGSSTFGNYAILQRIGQGGMGAVYKARQLNLDRIVALKLLPFGQFSRRDVVQRFYAEASAAAALQHPNIVAVHDVGEYDGQPFFSMDFVEGRTLAELVSDQPLSAKRAAGYLKTIAAAVHYAHQHGILHRDLKPSNVLVDAFDQPRITDFGLAKRLGGDSGLTLTGQVLGSPNFISPEQAEGRSGAIGAASDIYSLGALLYHLLTRQPPFQADTLTTLLKQVIENEPVAPRLLNPGIPKDLETICLKCLEKEPARRYATALALAEELSCFLSGQPIQARPIGKVAKAWKWCRARPTLAGLSAALLLTLLAGLTTVLLQLQRIRASESVARANAYAADMNLAQAAVDIGDIGAALELLNAHRPAPGQRDLRSWEWRYLWQQCRGDEHVELTPSRGVVERVAFSPDGQWLASRDDQSTLTLWDPKSGQRVSSFKMHGYLNPFAFSPRSNLLAYAVTGPRMVSVVNLDNGQEIARFPGTRNVLRVAFSADAARVIILEEDGSLAQWKLNSKQRLSTAALPQGDLPNPCKTVAFSPDGSVLAFESGNGFSLWEPDTGRRVLLRLSGAESPATALGFSSDAMLLAAGVGGPENEIRVWAVEDLWRATGETPTPRVRFGKQRDSVCDLAFSPNGRALASASSADSTVRVWELDRPEVSRHYQGHRLQVLSVAWSADGRTLASSGRDGSVRVWDPWRAPAASGLQVLPIASVDWSFRLSSNGRAAVFVEPTNGTVVLWDVVNARPAETLAFAGTNNGSVAWSSDDRMLAVGDFAGNLRVWDLPNRRLLSHMQLPGLVGFLFFTPDGRFLACGVLDLHDWRKLASVWRVQGWREIPIPPKALEKLNWATLSPDGRLFACLHTEGALDVWDLTTGRCRFRGFQPLASPQEGGFIALAPDGRTWASCTKNGVVALWDTKASQAPSVLPRSAHELWYIWYSPDSTRLMVSGKRASDVLRLLDVKSKRFVARLPGPPDVYWGTSMSADNNTLCAVGQQRVLLWRAPSWTEIESAEKKSVGR